MMGQFMSNIQDNKNIFRRNKTMNELKFLVEKGVDIAWIKANIDYDKEHMLGGQVWEVLADFYCQDHKNLGTELTGEEYFKAYRIIVDNME